MGLVFNLFLWTAAFFFLVSSDKTEKDHHLPDTSTQNHISDTPTPAPGDDLVFWVILTILTLSLIYLFTRYLFKMQLNHRRVVDTELDTRKGSDRRKRFARLRRNSSKPWLDHLDILKLDTPNTPDSVDNQLALQNIDHDADELIQSDISTDSVLNQHDPFRVGTPKAIHGGVSEYFGVASAAVLAILSVFILSNLEEF